MTKTSNAIRLGCIALLVDLIGGDRLDDLMWIAFDVCIAVLRVIGGLADGDLWVVGRSRINNEVAVKRSPLNGYYERVLGFKNTSRRSPFPLAKNDLISAVTRFAIAD